MTSKTVPIHCKSSCCERSLWLIAHGIPLHPFKIHTRARCWRPTSSQRLYRSVRYRRGRTKTRAYSTVATTWIRIPAFKFRACMLPRHIRSLSLTKRLGNDDEFKSPSLEPRDYFRLTRPSNQHHHVWSYSACRCNIARDLLAGLKAPL